MDDALTDFLIDKFEKKHRTRVHDDRARRQFADEARKAKELLTIDQKVEVRLEDVVGDKGLQYVI
jgi:molecular chaperone DnaK (HSP70)